MTIDPAEFRRVLGHLATGVSIVAARDPHSGDPHGLTVSAIASVSLEPSLVLVCIEQSADSHELVRTAGAFSINLLADDQERLSRHFAESEGGEKFRGIAWHEAVTGAPVLDDVLAWVDCRLWAEYPGGDHTIFVGEVIDANAREGVPLIHYRGGYGRYEP
ncbi:MAG: flavin reductase family protein [Longimicrobiales bacterium]